MSQHFVKCVMCGIHCDSLCEWLKWWIKTFSTKYQTSISQYNGKLIEAHKKCMICNKSDTGINWFINNLKNSEPGWWYSMLNISIESMSCIK